MCDQKKEVASSDMRYEGEHHYAEIEARHATWFIYRLSDRGYVAQVSIYDQRSSKVAPDDIRLAVQDLDESADYFVKLGAATRAVPVEPSPSDLPEGGTPEPRPCETCGGDKIDPLHKGYTPDAPCPDCTAPAPSNEGSELRLAAKAVVLAKARIDNTNMIHDRHAETAYLWDAITDLADALESPSAPSDDRLAVELRGLIEFWRSDAEKCDKYDTETDQSAAIVLREVADAVESKLAANQTDPEGKGE